MSEALEGFVRERHLGFFMLAPEPYVVTDERGTILELNLAAQRFFRAQGPTLRRKPMQVFFTDGDRAQFRLLLNQMIPGDVIAVELTMKPYHQEPRRIALSGVKLLQEGEEPVIYWLFRDITERVRAQEAIQKLNEHLEARVVERTMALDQSLRELQKANAAKDDFLGMVSHELRTPLAVALGNARLLANRRQSLSENEIDESLGDIIAAGDKLQNLIENLMVLARLDGKQAVKTEPVSLEAAIPRIVEDVRPLWPGTNYDVQLPSGLPPCHAVPAYLDQVLTNLLTNASKYGADTAPVRITARLGRRSVRVSVWNAGEPIAEEERQAIFQPFYRSGRTSGTQSGVGIGLTVVKRLVRVQGGRIWLGRPEQGTAFCFTLPLAERASD